MTAPQTKPLRDDTLARFRTYAEHNKDWQMAVAEIDRLKAELQVEKYMRLSEVAKALDVSVQTLKLWIGKKMIHAVQWEGVSGMRISKSEFTRFVNATYGGK